MNRRLRSAWNEEMRLGNAALIRNDLTAAFGHFERAHILGQRITTLHVRAHCGLLRVGWRRRDVHEVAGQCIRLVAATIFSRLWIPQGNTGGSNVSAFKRMPIPEDLRQFLD